MAIDSDKLMDLVNAMREALQDQTETCCDGAAVAGWLLLTFALDHTEDKTINDEVREYMRVMVEEICDNASAAGFELVQEH